MWGLMPAAGTLETRPGRGSFRLVDGWIIEAARDGVVVIHRAATASPQPPDWRQRLTESLRQLPGAGAGVVGAKRLTPDGRVFSMGELVVHPKGFHHLGRGVVREAYRFPEEVDAIGLRLCSEWNRWPGLERRKKKNLWLR